MADCTLAPPLRLSTRPAGITLACADDGLGVGKMSWSQWTPAAATGRGTFWEKLCVPSCTSGKIGQYAALVRLSDVQSSSQGPWFKRLTVTWLGTPPPSSTPVSYGLFKPGS